jgi:effector-binding domain-containing protein
VCVPVTGEVRPQGRVRAYTIAAARVARAMYHGPYEGLGAAWPELRAWIAAQGLTCAPGLWEVYVVGPESGLPPEAWQTELNQPLSP